MDPNENIKRQRELAARIVAAIDARPFSSARSIAIESLAAELAELVQALDEWRLKGGYDPYGRVNVLGQEPDVYELMARVREHPRFAFGVLFTADDFPDEGIPEDFVGNHIEDALVQWGGEFIADEYGDPGADA